MKLVGILKRAEPTKSNEISKWWVGGMAVTYENGKISNLVGMKKWLLPTEMRN